MTREKIIEILKSLDKYPMDYTPGEITEAIQCAVELVELTATICDKIYEKMEQFPDDKGLYTRGLYDGYYNSLDIINAYNK